MDRNGIVDLGGCGIIHTGGVSIFLPFFFLLLQHRCPYGIHPRVDTGCLFFFQGILLFLLFFFFFVPNEEIGGQSMWILTTLVHQFFVREAQVYRIFGMTARIIVDAARVAYAQEPEFEHNSHFGDEEMIAKLRQLGRLGEKAARLS